MDKVMEDYIEWRIHEEKIELAKNAIELGEFTADQIAETLGLSFDIVRDLAEEHSRELASV